VFVDNWRGGVDDEGYLRQELGPPMHDAVAGSANAKEKILWTYLARSCGTRRSGDWGLDI
jgi:hypothetical protein